MSRNTISAAGRELAAASGRYNKASKELWEVETAMKSDIEAELREVLDGITKKHGIVINGIFPEYAIIHDEGRVLVGIDVDIEPKN